MPSSWGAFYLVLRNNLLPVQYINITSPTQTWWVLCCSPNITCAVYSRNNVTNPAMKLTTDSHPSPEGLLSIVLIIHVQYIPVTMLPTQPWNWPPIHTPPSDRLLSIVLNLHVQYIHVRMSSTQPWNRSLIYTLPPWQSPCSVTPHQSNSRNWPCHNTTWFSTWPEGLSTGRHPHLAGN